MQSPTFGRAVLLVVSSFAFVAADAATINVTSGASTYDLSVACTAATIANLPGPDGVTTLNEAICAANNTAGADTLVLAGDVSLDAAFSGSTVVGKGRSGTPDILSAITINGGFAVRRTGSDFYRI